MKKIDANNQIVLSTLFDDTIIVVISVIHVVNLTNNNNNESLNCTSHAVAYTVRSYIIAQNFDANNQIVLST